MQKGFTLATVANNELASMGSRHSVARVWTLSLYYEELHPVLVQPRLFLAF